jgi:hypothetical protein
MRWSEGGFGVRALLWKWDIQKGREKTLQNNTTPWFDMNWPEMWYRI